MNNENTVGFGLIFIIILVIIIGFMFGVPAYNRYQKILNAKTELEAQGFLKQIAIADAEAEIERAKGVAESNRIIGEGLNNNENYLKYLFIQALREGAGDVIYIPTETGLPILEATRK